MSETEPVQLPEFQRDEASLKRNVPLREIFLTFLTIGATSFGGGVVAYLRSALVAKKKWLDDEEFLAALEISQALPGLNATNMSVIVGDRLRGPFGSVVAFLGVTLPGTAIVLALGMVYASNSHNPWIISVLKGVGASSVGLLLAVTLQIGHKQLSHAIDLIIVLATVLLVSILHFSLPLVMLCIAPVGIFLYRPHPARVLPEDKSGLDKKPIE
jgi:chromate transporter